MAGWPKGIVLVWGASACAGPAEAPPKAPTEAIAGDPHPEASRDPEREQRNATRQARAGLAHLTPMVRGAPEREPNAPAAPPANRRQRPQIPEMWSARGEVRLVCERQGGVYGEKGPGFACIDPDGVGPGSTPDSVALFDGTYAADQRIDFLNAYIEGADLRTTISALASTANRQPDGEFIIDGFRVFAWVDGNEVAGVRMHSRGVCVTFWRSAKPSPVPPSGSVKAPATPRR